MEKNKNGYYKIGDDLKGVFKKESLKEKLDSGGGVVIKSGYNIIRYAVKELPGAIERAKKRQQ